LIFIRFRDRRGSHITRFRNEIPNIDGLLMQMEVLCPEDDDSSLDDFDTSIPIETVVVPAEKKRCSFSSTIAEFDAEANFQATQTQELDESSNDWTSKCKNELRLYQEAAAVTSNWFKSEFDYIHYNPLNW